MAPKRPRPARRPSRRQYRWRRQRVGIARAQRRWRRTSKRGAGYALGLGVIAAAVAVFVLWRSPSLLPVDPVPVRFFQIATGVPGDTYFTVGRTLAAAISRPPDAEPCEDGGPCGVTGLIAIAKAAPGSIANLRAVNSGRIDAALAQADTASWAFRGRRMFRNDGPLDRLRAIASLYPEAVHLITAKRLALKSVGDLRGKKISLGLRASGTRANAVLILRAFNVRLRTLTLVALDDVAAADKMSKGELDAFFMVTGAPSNLIADLIRRDIAELVSIGGAPAAKLLKANGFFQPYRIKHGVYPGVAAVETIAVRALWVTSTRTSPILIRNITAALWNKSNRRLFDQAQDKTRAIALDTALAGIPLPLHDGARAYYREIGVLPQD